MGRSQVFVAVTNLKCARRSMLGATTTTTTTTV
jgi:hypothetical protein